jgi:hypothetical protein
VFAAAHFFERREQFRNGRNGSLRPRLIFFVEHFYPCPNARHHKEGKKTIM